MDLPAAKLSDLTATPRHPWVEKQNAFMDSDSKFKDDAERRRNRRLLGTCQLFGLAISAKS